MRHAKSSWKNEKLPDKERPLNKRGEKDAVVMSEQLCEKELYPQMILTSTALRCRLTASAVIEVCCNEITLKALDALYMAEPPAMIDVLNTIDDQVERVMVIGHNPGLESLLQRLTGEVESLPTASVAYLEIPVDSWAGLSLDTTVKKWDKWKPKDA
jgi:phosphohistidine phosphatase